MKKVFFIITIVCNLFTYAQNVIIPSPILKSLLVGNLPSAFNEQGNNFIIDSNNDDQIQISEALLVWKLDWDNRGLTDLTGIESFTNLREFYCGRNNIINMPFTTLIHLKILDVGECNLNALDVSNIPSLEFLWCPYNQISTLDLSNNPNLNKLICFNNNMTSLNLKNGIDQNLEYGNNIVWNGGNPGLTFICADASEVQGMLGYCATYNTPNGVPIPMIDSDCSLATATFVKNEVTVYPNPVTGTLNISGISNILNIKIYNMLGQMVQENAGATIDVSGLKAGNYFVRIETGEGIVLHTTHQMVYQYQ